LARKAQRASRKPRTFHDYAIAIATSLLAVFVLFFFLDTLDTLIDKGEICTRKHCRYWVTSPGSIVFTMGGIIALFFGLACAAFKCISALFKHE
jgi:hypothetical protein